MKNKEFISLVILGFIISFIIGLFLKNFISAIKFSIAYSLLFYIPILIWTIQIEKINIFTKYIITNLLGVSIIPIMYSIIGFFTNLNTILFISPPLLTAILGVMCNKNKFNKIFKEDNKPKNHEPAHNNSSIQ